MSIFASNRTASSLFWNYSILRKKNAQWCEKSILSRYEFTPASLTELNWEEIIMLAGRVTYRSLYESTYWICGRAQRNALVDRPQPLISVPSSVWKTRHFDAINIAARTVACINKSSSVCSQLNKKFLLVRVNVKSCYNDPIGGLIVYI